MNGRVGAVVTLTLAFQLSACVGEAANTGQLELSVFDLVEFDRDSEEAQYSLQSREVARLTDLDELSGGLLTMRRGGAISYRAATEELLIGSQFSDASPPRPRYHIDDGVVVARDYSTLVMFTAYYQFDRAFEVLAGMAGMTVEEYEARAGSYEILFEPAFRPRGAPSTSVVIKFNAFYMPGANQFGLARRSAGERVPMAAHPMVIAHEVGHALFEQLFYGGPSPECGQVASAVLGARSVELPGRLPLEFAVAGIGEGFADFSAFVVHGATQVLAGSGFPRIEERSLVRSGFRFEQLPHESCVGGHYCVGTLFARALYRAFLATGGDPESMESRQAFGAIIARALETTRGRMLSSGMLPPPRVETADCRLRRNMIADHDRQVLTAFVAALVVGVSEPGIRRALCSEFLHEFGASGLEGVCL